jgi:hypothetical protein
MCLALQCETLLCFIQGGPYHDLLQGLLGAYACYRPDVGYVSTFAIFTTIFIRSLIKYVASKLFPMFRMFATE